MSSLSTGNTMSCQATILATWVDRVVGEHLTMRIDLQVDAHPHGVVACPGRHEVIGGSR